ncbi:MAG: VRR-NUC domain-containing protein [Bermanella sp.]
MSLIKQCEKLSLLYEEVVLNYSDMPEKAALEFFKKQGYVGYYNEGSLILNVIKALMLDKLAELNIFNDRGDACSRYLEAQLTILHEHTGVLVSSIRQTSKDKFISNFQEIINSSYIKSSYPNLSVNLAVALFDALNTNDFINVAQKISEEPYDFRKGWPDLTIIKDNKVRFIEIKTTDKLKKSQMKTIPAMDSILPCLFSVLKVSGKSI